MNKILYQLASRNIQKYKKYYIYVTVIVLTLIVGFITYSIVWDNHYEVKKLYNQEHYGQWYFMADFDKRDKQTLEKLMTTFDTPVEYGYSYEQGFYQDKYKIGHVTDSVYELCHLELIEGRYPNADNEITISTDMASALNLKINQNLRMEIDCSNIHYYKIVGIIENSKPLVHNAFSDEQQWMHFFDIYTYFDDTGLIQIVSDRELATEISSYLVGYDNFEYNFQNVIFNDYGYSQSGMGQYHYANDQVIVFVEIICLAGFSLSMIMSISLKRRSDEFALLRGIGMTKRQLFLMIMYEIFNLIIAITIIGVILSLIISYFIMLYDEIQLGYFVCNYHFFQIIGYSLLLMFCILLAFMYPILSSTKRSLTGAFEGKTFQYFQIRYRKLYYQKKWRLALRELQIDKKISIALLVICSVIVLDYTVKIMTYNVYDEYTYQLHYFELLTEVKEHVDQTKDLNISHTVVTQYTDYNITYKDYEVSASIASLDDFQLLDNCQIKGHIPRNTNEVMIIDGYSIYRENENVAFLVNIGDMIEINNKEYKVVGSFLPNECNEYGYDSLYYLPSFEIYVSSEIYNQIDAESNYDIRVFYNTDEEKEKLEYILNNQIEYGWICSDDIYNLFSWEDYMEVDSYAILLPCIICFVFCYFLNKNYILNNYQNYALYRLVGMTKKDLLVKEFFKALILSIYMMVVQLFWIVMMNIGNGRVVIPIIDILESFVIVLLLLSIVYCLPLHHILKDNFVLSLKGKE